ncbi:MAG: ABC transporter permease subunit [Chloroflexi bacterium]|nr:ABC transporter permease subunit [Chloroflexota bacterium]
MTVRAIKGPGGDRVFKGATVSALALLALFFAVILGAMLSYTRWGPFLSALLSEEILFAVRLSLTTATIATALAMAIGIPAAYALSQMQFHGKSLVDSLLDLPIVISPIALGAALLIFFNTPAGAGINSLFVFAVPGIVLAQFAVTIGLAIRLLKSTFDGIDPRYEQVSRTLGYSKAKAFTRVTLPLARNGLIAATILTWARALGEFGATVTLAGATPLKTETLPTAIFLSLASADVARAIAVVLILVLIAAVALVLIRKVAGRGYPL